MLSLLLSIAADPTPVPSRIEDVTLYANSALVVRRAELPGSGNYVLAGLPWGMDANNVRVKCEGGDVIDVEVRERQEARVPDQRLQGLRDRVNALTREKQALEDERALIAAELEHLQRLMKLPASPASTPPSAGPTATSWNAHWQFLSDELARNSKAAREAQWKLDDKARELVAAQGELGRLQGAGTVALHDVIVEVVARGRATLEVGYFVSGTGWQPAYDLRTAPDLSKAELSYRARIAQQSGEDWSDVTLALSTAQPQRGAQGPDPVPIWLSVANVDRGLVGGAEFERDKEKNVRRYADVESARKVAEERAAEPTHNFATVQSEGLSVRFQLAGKQTVFSRPEPTTVLVGDADLAITPERHCVPAIDTTVWLRARAKNTSAWVLLPGRAAVFFGSDYFGEADIGAVQPGQELTLHLGADPSVTVKREQIEDLTKEPGLFSSRASKIDGWRVHIENHGAIGALVDGSIDVIVRESLPKPRDERIEVKVTKSEPAQSEADRWKQERQEKGILTWVVRVPKSGQADLVWQTTLTYPHDLKLVKE